MRRVRKRVTEEDPNVNSFFLDSQEKEDDLDREETNIRESYQKRRKDRHTLRYSFMDACDC